MHTQCVHHPGTLNHPNLLIQSSCVQRLVAWIPRMSLLRLIAGLTTTMVWKLPHIIQITSLIELQCNLN